MEEVKVRISAIDAGTNGSLQSLPPAMVREFCFLQIRMTSELIALACLVAHGDLTKASNLRKEWQADKIMDGLERLHPDFFPQSVLQSKDAQGHLVLSPRPGTLTKQDLLGLHGECNKFLHKGSLKSLLKGRFPVQIHFPDITAKAQKLNDLLELHSVFMSDHKEVYICILRSQPDHNVMVTIAAKTNGPPPEVVV
jgi:hypothetical protein